MFRKLSSVIVLAALAFVAGCGDDDNPVHSHDEEHAEVFGFVKLNSSSNQLNQKVSLRC